MKYSVKKSIKEYGATAMFICCCILSMLIDLSQFFQIETFSKFNSFLFVISILIGLYSIWRISKYYCIWNTNLFLKRISFCLLGVSGILLIHGGLQYGEWISCPDIFRMTGNFDNPAGFTLALCCCIPFILYLKENYNYSPVIKNTSVIILFLIVICILISKSRTAYICVLVMACMILTMRSRHSKKTIFLFVLGIITALILSYFFKKDSADGRLLIWKCTWEMIKDKPILGFGTGGFRANYMYYQANFFQSHPDSQYLMLADNITHPFNEYLLCLVNYGIIGILILGGFFIIIMKAYRKNQSRESQTALLCLANIAIFACFSYPLSYFVVWLLGILSLYILFSNADYLKNFSLIFKYYTHKGLLILSLIICIVTGNNMYQQIKWNTISKKALTESPELILAQYQQLLESTSLKEDARFLYNYAAELYYAKHYWESIKIANLCKKYWIDYDLVILLADSYMRIGDFKASEKYWKQASYMCPVRFIPLYELFQLYKTIGKIEDAKNIAKIIINKPVKIPSNKINFIQAEIRAFLSKQNISLL